MDIKELFEKKYAMNAPSWSLERDPDGSYKYHATQSAFVLFEQQQIEIESLKVQLEKAQVVPEGFVLVPTKSVKYFSNNGENYEIHDTLAEAKREAECAIEHFSERLADQLSDPRSDGNFQDVGYGVVLAQSAYSIDHIVTQDDIDNDDYSYEVGTEIMSLFLAEAQEQSHEHS